MVAEITSLWVVEQFESNRLRKFVCFVPTGGNGSWYAGTTIEIIFYRLSTGTGVTPRNQRAKLEHASEHKSFAYRC